MKKQVLMLIALVFAVCIPAFSQYQVNCIGTKGESMSFRVVGYGKNAKKASENAELSVIKALMFEGIPNTQMKLPLVSELEENAMKEHKSFLSAFFDSGYKGVITRSVILRKFGKDENKQKSITLEVAVNVSALRLKLEQGGVIRRFGI